MVEQFFDVLDQNGHKLERARMIEAPGETP